MNKTNFFVAIWPLLFPYLEEEQRHGTAHVYRSVLRRVIEFEGLDVLEFNDLTPLLAPVFPGVSVEPPTSLEYYFYLYEDVACYLFS